MTDGEALAGGAINEVVRIGDTVHRSAGPWTPTIHRLLSHIRDRGFTTAPEPLGFDQDGREILRWLPGDMADADFSNLQQIGALVRSLHEATVGFDRTDAIWRWSGYGGDEVICHNDLSPWNFLVEGRDVVGIVDWDVASPGDALNDFAIVLWRFGYLHPSVRLRSEDRPLTVDERLERVRALARGYDLGEGAAARVVERVERVIAMLRAYIEERAAAGDPTFQRLLAAGTTRSSDESLGWIADHRAELERALS